ncbi:MAG TPA: T9SS type A sorting domain-containing protein [Bacteroidia bacterium]|nr:T9SS type A sorting domain-containing protein [Bacteroidia bacterium]
MKKTLFTLACALGLTICTQAQVVLQSDFETWTGVQAVSGWDGSKTNITTTPDSARKDSVGPYHGTYCVALVNPTTTAKRFSTQPIAITAGSIYNIRFWVKGMGVIRTGLQGVKYSNGFGYEYGSYVTVNSPGWVSYTQTLLADTNNAAAQFLFSVKSTSGIFALDSVTITNMGTAPNVSLYQVQYTTASPANSPYMNQYVTTGGIVTAVYNGSSGTQSGYYLQTSHASAWSAVNVYDYSHIVAVGDSVNFSGQVQEYYNETEIAQVVNFTKVSSGNQAKTPTTLVGLNTIQNEKYEGMLIKVNGVTDVRYNTAAAWYVFSDSTITNSLASEDTVDNIIYTYGYTQGKKYNITGVVHFEYANWIEPRNINDIDSINVVSGIKNIQNNFTDVAIYPNPNNGAFTVAVTALVDEKNTNFILTDLAGRIVYNSQLDTHTGLNAYQINTNNLAKGTYFLQISNAQAKTVKKIIVQ